MTDFKSPCVLASCEILCLRQNLRKTYGKSTAMQTFYSFRPDRADMALELEESLSSYSKPTASLRQTDGRKQNSR